MPGLYTTGYKLFYKDMGPWNSSTNYNPGETVTYNFTTYLCIGQVVNLPAQTPDAATTFWVTITNPSVTSDLGDRFLISATSTRGRTIDGLIEKEYLIDFYSNLIPTFRQAGLFAAGLNSSGELGKNDTNSSVSLVQTVANGNNWRFVASALAYNFKNATIATKTDGTLWTWGSNAFGALGDNTTTSRSSPVQTIAGGTDWKQGATGGDSSAAIKTDGTLWLWGRNQTAQLGDNTTVDKSSPVQVFGGGTNWKQVSIGPFFAGAVKTDGTLWLWGYNSTGCLGNNNTVSYSSPVQTVTGGNNWVQVSTGYLTACAIKTDGTLWCWGAGAAGILGNNSITDRSSPVQTVTGGNNWKSVCVSKYYEYTGAIKTDGTLWTWGRNDIGFLGDNSTVNKSSPVQTVIGGTDWRTFNTTTSHSAAIKFDGSLWVWGSNTDGGLAIGTTFTHKSSPVQTSAGGNNWRHAAAGYGSTFAIRDFSDI